MAGIAQRAIHYTHEVCMMMNGDPLSISNEYSYMLHLQFSWDAPSARRCRFCWPFFSSLLDCTIFRAFLWLSEGFAIKLRRPNQLMYTEYQRAKFCDVSVYVCVCAEAQCNRTFHCCCESYRATANILLPMACISPHCAASSAQNNSNNTIRSLRIVFPLARSLFVAA